MNVQCPQHLTQLGAEITYRETPGMAHEWDFWDMEIRNVLAWLQQK